MKYQDIQISDVSLRKQFVDYWNLGQYQSALNILQESQLSGKKMISSNISSLYTQIGTLEDYYYNGVEDKLSDELEIFNDHIENMVDKGTWDDNTTYYKSNYVVYQEYVYMCIETNTNELPTNTTYWVYLGLKGDVGEYGIGVTLRYSWSSTVQYSANDVVLYNDALYFAISSNINSIPTDLVDWSIFLEIEKTTITTSSTAPSSPSDGLIWFEEN